MSSEQDIIILSKKKKNNSLHTPQWFCFKKLSFSSDGNFQELLPAFSDLRKAFFLKIYLKIIDGYRIEFNLITKRLYNTSLIYWMLDVIQTASYEITLVRPSVRPSLGFLKIGPLGFSGIVHDESWPWYLVTDKARFLIKKLAARIWGKCPKIGP